MEIKAKYSSWADITIADYKRIQEILSSDADEMEKNVELLAVICDADTDDIWDMDIDTLSDLTDSLGWLKDFDESKIRKNQIDKVKLKSYTCNVMRDLSTFTVAQYVDFQNYWREDHERNLTKILSCFLVPDGQKYNEGYDIAELVNEIDENMSICVAKSIYFFFVNSYITSMQDILKSLDIKKRKMDKRKMRQLNHCKMVLNGFLDGLQ